MLAHNINNFDPVLTPTVLQFVFVRVILGDKAEPQFGILVEVQEKLLVLNHLCV